VRLLRIECGVAFVSRSPPRCAEILKEKRTWKYAWQRESKRRFIALMQRGNCCHKLCLILDQVICIRADKAKVVSKLINKAHALLK
jgi:hypothetical protein